MNFIKNENLASPGISGQHDPTNLDTLKQELHQIRQEMLKMINKTDESHVADSNPMVQYSGNQFTQKIPVNSACSWLIDSGAPCHIYANKAIFPYHCAYSIKPTICLLVGSTCHPKFYGDIKLSKHITLQHVFFVPQFRFNLLSVSCLTKDNILTVMFSCDHCYF